MKNIISEMIIELFLFTKCTIHFLNTIYKHNLIYNLIRQLSKYSIISHYIVLLSGILIYYVINLNDFHNY